MSGNKAPPPCLLDAPLPSPADMPPSPAPPAAPKQSLASGAPAVQELLDIVDQLRDPGGCDWDRAQTLGSMRSYLLEEAHELVEAIDRDDPAAVAEELGDLLFNVFLMTRIAADRGTADLSTVAGGIAEKMRRRHPHVWPPAAAPEAPVPDGAQAVVAGWERRKLARRAEQGLLDGVPKKAPALLVAHRQGQRVAAVGFDWTTTAGVLNKVHEELGELEHAIASADPAAIDHELGDVLMSLASLGRHLDTPAEDALRHANQRFARRFATVEALTASEGQPLSTADPDHLEALWARAKAREDG